MKLTIQSLICVFLISILYSSSWAQKPDLEIQTGHSGSVFSVAFSPDGKLLASASADQTIKLWDVASGGQVRSFKGHSSGIISVAFSPDGKLLASGGSDNAIKIWDIASGAQRKSLRGNAYAVRFSTDGNLIAGATPQSIIVWDVASGTQLFSLNGHTRTITSVAISPDGKTIASGSQDHTVKLWDVTSKAQIRSLTHPDEVMSVAFSPDGKWLVSAGLKTIKIWDVMNWVELKSFDGGISWPNCLAISPDGKTLAGGSLDKPTGAIKLWDVSSGGMVKLVDERPNLVITSVAFSPDGRTLANASFGEDMMLWDVASKSPLRRLSRLSSAVTTSAFSPDGKFLASGGFGEDIKLWDMTSGGQFRSLEISSPEKFREAFKLMGSLFSMLSLGQFNIPNPIAFSPDAKILASTSFDDKGSLIRLWDVASGTQLHSLKGHDIFVTSIAFSPDGKLLASASYDETVRLWDVASGTQLKILTKKADFVNAVVFSPDGKLLASAGFDKTVHIWDVASGVQLHALQGHSSWINSLAFSPDGKLLASASGGTQIFATDTDQTVRLWDVASGAAVRSLEGHSGIVTSVTFSPDGKLLASASADKSIKLWDVASGVPIKSLEGHADVVTSVTFSLDGKRLVSSSQDATLKVWSPDMTTPQASLISLGKSDWLVETPNNLFDGSIAAWQRCIWRFNSNTFDYAPVEAFFSEFYYPGLLADIFASKRPQAPSNILEKDRRQPQLRITLADAQSAMPLTSRTVSVKIEISQAPAGAQDVRLFRNGSLVKVWHGEVLKRQQKNVTLEVTVPIIAGENRFTVYAFNHDNIKSSDATLIVNGAESLKRVGKAYILSIGVNTYSNSNYNLKYAVADAEDFAIEFKRQQELLKQYEYLEIIPLHDKDATKATILQKLSQLANKVQPEDAVIVYFSGHGTAQQQRFYLIPYDLGYQGPRTKLSASNIQTILQHSISDRNLEEAFEKINAGHMLMVIDACNSGQALDAEEKRRGPMNSKGLAQLAYEKGMYILTAAQSYQAAWEASRLGHGFLTYALVEDGLKQGKADREPEDGRIVLREWLNYATQQVPLMQEEQMRGTPVVKDRQGRELELVFVEGDEDIKDPAKRSVQRPRVFYRRELEPLPLIVARPQSMPSKN